MARKYVAWNTCTSEAVVFDTWLEACAHTFPSGARPNRIHSDAGGEWVRGAYPDRAPQWFGTRQEQS